MRGKDKGSESKVALFASNRWVFWAREILSLTALCFAPDNDAETGDFNLTGRIRLACESRLLTGRVPEPWPKIDCRFASRIWDHSRRNRLRQYRFGFLSEAFKSG